MRTSGRALPGGIVSVATVAVAFMAFVAVAGTARADEAKIRRDLKAFFATEDAATRAKLAKEIETDPAYDRKKVSAWLHAAGLFEPLKPGNQEITAKLGGAARTILLRVPQGYDPNKAYPLIYALHPAGTPAAAMIDYTVKALDTQAEAFIVAAPAEYRDFVIQKDKPATPEHTVFLRAIKHHVNVNSNRVYVLGYDVGGHAAWLLAVSQPDDFAGVISVSGALLLPSPVLDDTFLRNVANLPVLAVWGKQDTLDAAGKPRDDGGIAGLDTRLVATAKRLKVPVEGVEDPTKGHGDVTIPPEALKKLLAHERPVAPAKVDKHFRAVGQSSTYGLEGDGWMGDALNGKKLEVIVEPGEDVNSRTDFDKAFARAFRIRLAELLGDAKGQALTVTRRKVNIVTVWLYDGLVDLAQPVTLTIGATKVFNGKMTPSLLLALPQAAKTWDFERLRWAGLQSEASKDAKPVTVDTKLADPTAE